MKHYLIITIIFISFLYAEDAYAGVTVKSSLNSGLVGYWNFDVGKGGATAYDMSGNRNHGTLTNMNPATAWVDSATSTGRILGTALNFNGSNAYVDTKDITLSGAFTIAGWFKWSSAVNDILFDNNNACGGGNYILYVDATTFYILASAIGAHGGITQGQWYFIAITRNSSNLVSGYKNANLIGTVTKVSSLNFTSITCTAFPFGGKMDEIRLYNRALSNAEISRLYNLSKSKIGRAGKTVKVNSSTVGKLTNGLVGHWTFDGPDMAGVTAYDRSGQGNNGTLTNGPVRAIGKFGQALDFDGTSNYVDLGNVSPLNFTTGNFSISAWVKTSDSSGTIDGIVAKTLRYQLYMNNSKAEFALYDGVNNPFITGTSNINNGVWRHIAAVRNSGKIILYVDGVQENSGNDSAGNISSADSVYIGARRPSSNEYWHGSIDEARIYNRALSVDEVKRLYNMGR